nr:hypothetical protein [uncultured Acetatifactor sp.]
MIAAESVFLQGYRSVKALEADYAEKRKRMWRFCNLYSYAGLIRCVAEGISHEPDWTAGLRKKLCGKIGLLESGVAG